MPEEPIPAAVWPISKLTADLQSAKMWPVKLQGVKHQEALSTLTYISTILSYNNEIYANNVHIEIIHHFSNMISKLIKWPRAVPGKSMTAHAEELTAYVAKEILGFPAGLGEPIVQCLPQTWASLGMAVASYLCIYLYLSIFCKYILLYLFISIYIYIYLLYQSI